VSETKRRVGRPEKTDSEGKRIITKVVNVNAPVKFLEFLKDNGVNRSELFTKVAASYYEGVICVLCYAKLDTTIVGSHCPDCAADYYKRTRETKTMWRSFNNCPNCNESYSYENLFRQSKQGLDGCQICGIV
jgi:hypothetical protein